MTTQFNSNERQLSRLKIAPQSKIPKPKVVASSSTFLSSFPVQDLSSESNNTPTSSTNNFKTNLDFLLESGLKAQIDTVSGEEHSWLIGAERGSSDVDDFLNQFEDCIDVEGPLQTHYVPSDVESQGSHDGPIDDVPIVEEEELEMDRSNHLTGYLQAFVGKLCSMAKTLEWLKAQPFSFTPSTPLYRSRNKDTYENDTRSGAASSCKSSRSLSAAFDLAAIEPAAFGFTELPSSCCISRSTEIRLSNYLEEDNYEDYLSACSDFEDEEETIIPTTAAAGSPGGQVSVSSKSSGADSDELHQSLLNNASLRVDGVNDWLSNGWQPEYQ
jgi:hypothetical protein